MWKQIAGSVGALVVLFLLYWRRLIQQRPRTLQFTEAPSLRSSLFSMVLCILFKREGKFFGGFTTVPRLEGILKGAKYVDVHVSPKPSVFSLIMFPLSARVSIYHDLPFDERFCNIWSLLLPL
jgi:uncharacterized membrane protein (UPF0182 family)